LYASHSSAEDLAEVLSMQDLYLPVVEEVPGVYEGLSDTFICHYNTITDLLPYLLEVLQLLQQRM
jgi:hypothetical protein